MFLKGQPTQVGFDISTIQISKYPNTGFLVLRHPHVLDCLVLFFNHETCTSLSAIHSPTGPPSQAKPFTLNGEVASLAAIQLFAC